MNILIVIPTYNEAENVEPLTEELLALDLDAHILFVDDASPDGTGDIADRLAARHDRVHVIHREGKLGLGSAISAGLVYGREHGADHVMTMDADFSHDPSYLPALKAGMEDHDIMIGSRYIPGGGTRDWGIGRRVLSRSANIVARFMLGLPAKDATAGLRCYKRSVLEEVDPTSIRSEGYSYQEEMLFRCHRAGFSIGETPIIFTDRRAGKSKINRSEVFKAVWTLFRLRFGG